MIRRRFFQALAGLAGAALLPGTLKLGAEPRVIVSTIGYGGEFATIGAWVASLPPLISDVHIGEVVPGVYDSSAQDVPVEWGRTSAGGYVALRAKGEVCRGGERVDPRLIPGFIHCRRGHPVYESVTGATVVNEHRECSECRVEDAEQGTGPRRTVEAVRKLREGRDAQPR